MSAPVSMEFARLMSRANSAMGHQHPADFLLTKAERARLARLLSEARKHAQRKRDSKLFEYCGARFRLMTFNGWLIVMTWNGRPLAGPVRIDRRCLTPSTSRGMIPRACKQQATGVAARMTKADESATPAVFLRPPHVLPFLWRAVWGSRKACRFLCPGPRTPHRPVTPSSRKGRDSDRRQRSTSHA